MNGTENLKTLVDAVDKAGRLLVDPRRHDVAKRPDGSRFTHADRATQKERKRKVEHARRAANKLNRKSKRKKR